MRQRTSPRSGSSSYSGAAKRDQLQRRQKQHECAPVRGVADANQTERDAREEAPVGAGQALEVHRRPELRQRGLRQAQVGGLNSSASRRCARLRRCGPRGWRSSRSSSLAGYPCARPRRVRKLLIFKVCERRLPGSASGRTSRACGASGADAERDAVGGVARGAGRPHAGSASPSCRERLGEVAAIVALLARADARVPQPPAAPATRSTGDARRS